MPRPALPIKRVVFALALTLATISAAHASGLQVMPVSIQLPSGSHAEAIWLSNSAQSTLTAQIRTFAWSQKDGEDFLTPTTQLTAAPAIVEIAPGERQLVRVLRTGASAAVGAERTYRLIVDELPSQEPQAQRETQEQQDPQEPQELAAQPQAKRRLGMNLLMRYSVPVFVGDATDESAKQISHQLRWTLQKQSDRWIFRVRNDGAIRAQLANLQAVRANGQLVTVLEGMMGYVLPGSVMPWTVAPMNAEPAITGFQAMINSAVQRIDVLDSP